jgi:hypothetical protein
MASELFVDKLYPGPNSTSIELSATSSISFKTNGSTQLTIDSSGRLLTPNRPYFYVRRGGSQADGQSAGTITWNTVLVNDGGHFVTSGTGAYERFVAPVNGIYVFHCMPGYKQTSVEWNMYWYLNGSPYQEAGRLIGSPPNSHSTLSSSIALKLNTNDYVYVNIGYTHHRNASTEYFTGYLLG